MPARGLDRPTAPSRRSRRGSAPAFATASATTSRRARSEPERRAHGRARRDGWEAPITRRGAPPRAAGRRAAKRSARACIPCARRALRRGRHRSRSCSLSTVLLGGSADPRPASAKHAAPQARRPRAAGRRRGGGAAADARAPRGGRAARGQRCAGAQRLPRERARAEAAREAARRPRPQGRHARKAKATRAPARGSQGAAQQEDAGARSTGATGGAAGLHAARGDLRAAGSTPAPAPRPSEAQCLRVLHRLRPAARVSTACPDAISRAGCGSPRRTHARVADEGPGEARRHAGDDRAAHPALSLRAHLHDALPARPDLARQGGHVVRVDPTCRRAG